MKRSVFDDNYFDHDEKVPIMTYGRARTIFQKAQEFKGDTNDHTRFMLEQMVNKIDKEVQDEFKTQHIPKCITENQHQIDEAHFRQFQKKYLIKKKNLELQVIRDNKRQEIINEIIDDSTFLD